MNIENPSLDTFRKTVVRLLVANLCILSLTCFFSYMSFKEAEEASSKAKDARFLTAQLKFRLIKEGVIKTKENLKLNEAVKETEFLREESKHGLFSY